MIQLTDITKSFTSETGKKNTLYNKLNFTIEEGDFIAILGKSGCGKTTLLNMISGLTSFDEGEITANNERYSTMKEDTLTQFRGKNMSFIFQQFHLIPNLNVEENIELPLDINHIPRRFTPDEILDKVGLEDKTDSYIYTLSGGEQQRVAIARAFIGKTPIILADEPTGNLDEKNAKNIMELLSSLHKETGVTIIMITHDTDIAGYASKTYELKNNILTLQ